MRQQREANERLQQMSEGLMKVSRAAVLLGFTQDESLQKLVKNLALVQAGFDAFDGSRKVITSLSQAMDKSAQTGQSLATVLGRGNVMLAAMAAAATATALAYRMLNEEKERAKKDFNDNLAGRGDLRGTILQLSSPEDRARDAQIRMDAAMKGMQRAGPLQGINARWAGDAARDLLAAEKQITDQRDAQLRKTGEAVRKQQEQLQLAEQRLESEKRLTRSVQASFSQLESTEQHRLSLAVGKLKRGEDISEDERKLFERAGQGGIAEASRAREGRAEGADVFIDSVRGLEGATTGTTGSVKELQKEFDKLGDSIEKFTGGKGAEAFLNGIEQQGEQIARGFQSYQAKILKLLQDGNKNMDRIMHDQQAQGLAIKQSGGGIGGGSFGGGL